MGINYMLEPRVKNSNEMATMTGSRRVQSRSKDDVFDRFFSWSEGVLCTDDVTRSISTEDDALDRVFEKIESLTCREGADFKAMQNCQSMTLERSNSIVDHNLIQACKAVQEKFQTKTELQKSINSLGKKGDILDYCFEHVETYACGENLAGSKHLAISHRGTCKTSSRTMSHGEVEAEIQLYYQPC